MKSALILTALVGAAAGQALAAPETRPPADAELASFHAHYRQQFPGPPSAKPVFSITRETAKGAWTITATVDSSRSASSRPASGCIKPS